MALTKEQAEKIRGRGRIDATSWCCSGPFPLEGCPDWRTHWHADCTVCHWTENPRFWGPTPEDVAALLIEHLDQEHAPAWTQEALF